MYERFVNQLKEYSQAIRILSKGYLPISLYHLHNWQRYCKR